MTQAVKPALRTRNPAAANTTVAASEPAQRQRKVGRGVSKRNGKKTTANGVDGALKVRPLKKNVNVEHLDLGE